MTSVDVRRVGAATGNSKLRTSTEVDRFCDTMKMKLG